MKKVSELVLLTLFFSTLVGFGLTTGLVAYFGIARLIVRAIS